MDTQGLIPPVPTAIRNNPSIDKPLQKERMTRSSTHKTYQTCLFTVSARYVHALRTIQCTYEGYLALSVKLVDRSNNELGGHNVPA